MQCSYFGIRKFRNFNAHGTLEHGLRISKCRRDAIVWRIDKPFRKLMQTLKTNVYVNSKNETTTSAVTSKHRPNNKGVTKKPTFFTFLTCPNQGISAGCKRRVWCTNDRVVAYFQCLRFDNNSISYSCLLRHKSEIYLDAPEGGKIMFGHEEIRWRER